MKLLLGIDALVAVMTLLSFISAAPSPVPSALCVGRSQRGPALGHLHLRTSDSNSNVQAKDLISKFNSSPVEVDITITPTDKVYDEFLALFDPGYSAYYFHYMTGFWDIYFLAQLSPGFNNNSSALEEIYDKVDETILEMCTLFWWGLIPLNPDNSMETVAEAVVNTFGQAYVLQAKDTLAIETVIEEVDPTILSDTRAVYALAVDRMKKAMKPTFDFIEPFL